jgi:guanine deaminase
VYTQVLLLYDYDSILYIICQSETSYRQHFIKLHETRDQEMTELRGLPLAFHGTIIHTLDANTLEILPNTLLIISSSGHIEKIFKHTPLDQVNDRLTDAGHTPDVFPVRYLQRGEFLVPGFIDTHHHAPQWAQRGMGRDQTLLEWLNNVTFAHERKFEDAAYAKRMYTACVQAGIKQGVTTASYYGSVHVEASKILADICLEQRQRAFVGKCNMNRSSPEWYQDLSAEDSLKETRELVAHVRRIDSQGKLVKPILTPRFAITCDDALLSGLGKIVQETPDIHVQTHFNEAVDEMEYTRQLYPQFQHEADLYDEFNLLGPQTILAHSIFLKEEEMDRIQSKGCGIAHCPISTATLGEFMMAPIREYLRRGIKVGLGTDVGGGFSSSMLDIMRHAFIISKARETFTKGADPALKLHEGFFLATLGGAQVCGIQDKVGNFVEGKEFDALEIHTIGSEPCGSSGVMSPIEDEDSVEVIFEKFLMTGDDRNIAKVYIAGLSVKD